MKLRNSYYQAESQDVRCVPAAVRCRKTHKDPQPQLDHSCSRSLATLVSMLVRDGRNGAFPKLGVPFFGVPYYNKDYSISGSILGSPPYREPTTLP